MRAAEERPAPYEQGIGKVLICGMTDGTTWWNCRPAVPYLKRKPPRYRRNGEVDHGEYWPSHTLNIQLSIIR